MQNNLIAHNYVKLDSSIQDAIEVLASSNEVNVSMFENNYRFYAEKDKEVEPIIDR